MTSSPSRRLRRGGKKPPVLQVRSRDPARCSGCGQQDHAHLPLLPLAGRWACPTCLSALYTAALAGDPLPEPPPPEPQDDEDAGIQSRVQGAAARSRAALLGARKLAKARAATGLGR